MKKKKDPRRELTEEDRHSLQTAITEGRKLSDGIMERYGAKVEYYTQTISLAWGVLKAIYECPYCPGHFRVPLDVPEDDREWIICPNCKATWVTTKE